MATQALVSRVPSHDHWGAMPEAYIVRLRIGQFIKQKHEIRL